MIIDQSVALWVYSIRTPFLTKVFLFCTVFGNAPVVITVIVALAIVGIILHRQRTLVIFTIAIAAALSISLAIKDIFQRARPLDGLIPSTGYSFPSGHALMSTVCYGLIGYYVYRHSNNRILRTVGGIFMIGMPLCIGFSRIYLGVHWFSDVLGGWIIGSIILCLFITLFAHKK